MSIENNFYDTIRELLNESVILNEDGEMGAQPNMEEAPQQMPMDPSQQDQPPMDGEAQDDEEMMDPEMQDADYMMNPEGQDAAPPPDPSDTRKAVHLFDNFDELRKMTENFKNKLDDIDYNLIDGHKTEYLKLVYKNTENLIEKIKEHMIYNYAQKQYEENLYIYMLLRAELLTNISLLRKKLNIRKK